MIIGTFYIHQQLTESHTPQKQNIRVPSYKNYNEILIDTPLASPEAEEDSGSISIRRAIDTMRNKKNDDDAISMISDNMSMVSLEEDETLSCNKGSPIEMPRGVDTYQTNNDNAKHIFSSQDQMRVFDRHTFVKDIGNGRVNVDTTGKTARPLPNPYTAEPQPCPIGMSSLASYGTTLMASYGDNDNTGSGYMSGVVPYQG